MKKLEKLYSKLSNKEIIDIIDNKDNIDENIFKIALEELKKRNLTEEEILKLKIDLFSDNKDFFNENINFDNVNIIVNLIILYFVFIFLQALFNWSNLILEHSYTLSEFGIQHSIVSIFFILNLVICYFLYKRESKAWVYFKTYSLYQLLSELGMLIFLVYYNNYELSILFIILNLISIIILILIIYALSNKNLKMEFKVSKDNIEIVKYISIIIVAFHTYSLLTFLWF